MENGRSGRFHCEFCDKTFPFSSVLRSHQRVHTGEKPYECEECGKRFAQKGSLTIHGRRHTGEKPYKCPFCSKAFASQGNMKIHERQHTGERPYTCVQCGKTFATLGSLRTHETSHANTKTHPCDICGKSFAHRSSLYTHKKRHSSSNENTSTDSSPSPHLIQAVSMVVSNNAAPKPLFPENEVSSFADAKLRLMPTPELATKPTNPHVCFCGKSFAYRSLLESHLRSHTGEKPFPCAYCHKRFAQKATLQPVRFEVHERIHTGEKPYKCSFCSKAFTQYGTKAVHEKSHLGLRAYKCPICDKVQGLSSPSALYTHKKTHGERNILCPACPKRFTLKAYLKLHLQQVHSQHLDDRGTTPCGDDNVEYFDGTPDIKKTESHSPELREENKEKLEGSRGGLKCKWCGKSFAYASSLYVHTRLHTGERPFKCRFCPKAFTNQGNMQVHERVHTGEKPYACELCGKAYAQRVGLNIHSEQCRRALAASFTSPPISTRTTSFYGR